MIQIRGFEHGDYGIIDCMRARWIRLGSIDVLDFDEACERLSLAQSSTALPVVLWGEGERQHPFALIAPLRRAPGNRLGWPAWGLAPAVAAYRQFGVPAYLNDNEIWLHGRRIAESLVERVGQCVVVASSFLTQFPAKCVPTPPVALEQAYRLRLEAQHGWQFEHSWPTRPETLDCAVA
jgi:hypothetical protein